MWNCGTSFPRPTHFFFESFFYAVQELTIISLISLAIPCFATLCCSSGLHDAVCIQVVDWVNCGQITPSTPCTNWAVISEASICRNPMESPSNQHLAGGDSWDMPAMIWYDTPSTPEIQESHEVVKANLAFIKIMRGTVNTTTWYVDKRNHSISWTGGLVKTALRFESVNWTYTPLFHGGALGLAWSKLRLTKIMPDCQAGSTASGL